MLKVKKRITKIGESYGVIIPKVWLESNKITQTDEVEVIIERDKIIIKANKNKKEVK